MFAGGGWQENANVPRALTPVAEKWNRLAI
jgi:hypothetical protein